MIAKLRIEDGKFSGGFVRTGEEKLRIQDNFVEWPKKWQVTLRPDAIVASSFRATRNGGNVLVFEVGLNGYSKLSLRLVDGRESRLVKMNQVFKTQNNLDGDLYLIYNSNGYRSAYFYSTEFLEWKKKCKIVNVLGKDPNALEVKDRMATEESHASSIDGLSAYTTGLLTIITDGDIVIKNRYDSKLNKKQYFACAENASWVILEKTHKSRIGRVLITQRPVFELQLPEEKFDRIKQYSSIGLELFSKSECVR